ncbi:MAG: inositol 2-dehydrogenase [Spirochaetales bacterium]|nr:inositol 2-dehydrogenase [Spirochaetales bacterium]
MINIGIIGAGRIGQVHARSIVSGVPGARVAMVADPFIKPEVKQWMEGIGAKVVSDYHDILSCPEIDAVLICSSTDTHAPISIEAIKAQKHVFCEKPVDLSPAKIREVEKALAASPKKLCFQVGFNRRFDHNFEALRKATMEGRIGDVQFVRVSSRDPNPPAPQYVAVSGGIFLDMMIHDIDMVRYLSGAEIEEVYARGACLIDPEIGKQGDVDSATVSIKLSNGALALIDNSRRAAYGYDQRAEVFGSLGAIQNGNDSESTAVLSTEAGVTAEKPLYFFLERYMASYQKEMRLFVEAVTNGTEVPVGLKDGLMSIRIGLACKKSLAENRPVRIDEI